MKRIDTPGSQGRIEATPFGPREQPNRRDFSFMYSLYYVLTDQHREEFAPLRCNEQTISRLVRYFEDVVTENNLPALVIEGRCLSGELSRETNRMAKLSAVARRVYLFSCGSECEARACRPEASSNLTILEEKGYHGTETGQFILVAEPRFCGLLASCLVSDGTNNLSNAYEMVWTFDPNVVFTAIEYLLARVSTQSPGERDRFESLLEACTPRSSSLRLALSFTTKVTMLMQRQNELEMATNRISSAISSTLELESILQSAVEEVGRALKAHRAAVVLWQPGSNMPEGMSIYERPESATAGTKENSSATRRVEGSANENLKDVPPSSNRAAMPDPVRDREAENSSRERNGMGYRQEKLPTPGLLEVPIAYRNNVIGVLVVEDDTPLRNWEDEELLMVNTVCDQLSIAISHARLFQHVQTQAMTDDLTGLYNHRHFQERLDREIKLADRKNDVVSLILLDLDHLKNINDTHGHPAGDRALCHLATIMRATLRDVDICARYGGEEFVVILPGCNRENALLVAERLRDSIASTPVQRVGQITASIGFATYPTGAKNKEELIEMADRAMYLAKAAGRNRIRTLAHRSY
ncbi:MAG: sensor domain-containing diguanylate cyclase [Blastocatellia bacterium]